jgi:hypothetical protein
VAAGCKAAGNTEDASWAAANAADDNAVGASPAGVQWAGERVVDGRDGCRHQVDSVCRDERLQ